MELTPLERDLLGDLAADSHALWEIFGFVRLHHPGLPDEAVLGLGRSLISSWLDRRWLALGTAADAPVSITLADLLPLIDRLGVAATYGFTGAPWLDLAEQAYVDVKWLRPAV